MNLSFFDIPGADIIGYCLQCYLTKNLNAKGYCDVSELFSDQLTKADVKASVVLHSEELNLLYKRKFPESINDIGFMEDTYSLKYWDRMIQCEEAFAILFWCFRIFKKYGSFDKNKGAIVDSLVAFLNHIQDDICYTSIETILYDKKVVDIHLINSVSDFLKNLNTYASNKTLYFRGHSKASYKLEPSIMRTKKLKENEHLIYQELLISCPDDFKDCNHHIEYLVKMQHYGLPTRLLDITRNPLVALYFACCNNPNSIGEVIVLSPSKEQIKYENSDTVTMISSLPAFSYEEQIMLMDTLDVPSKGKTNIVDRFIHEIREEKPGFIDRIQHSDLDTCFVVLTKKNNNRIVKQDGAFVICGINNSFERIINEQLCLARNDKKPLFFITNKKAILKELDLLSINKSTLFPEIDQVSEYIKTKYCT